MCSDIIENGNSPLRARRSVPLEDGTSAYTIKKFIPVTLRRSFLLWIAFAVLLQSAKDEILWIYQKKSNNVNDLNSYIWDSWAGESGSIGKAYGYQVDRFLLC